MKFNVDKAKSQVEAVPNLALPYLLDAFDEIERVYRLKLNVSRALVAALEENQALRKVAYAAAEHRRMPLVDAAARRLDDALCDLETQMGGIPTP